MSIGLSTIPARTSFSIAVLSNAADATAKLVKNKNVIVAKRTIRLFTIAFSLLNSVNQIVPIQMIAEPGIPAEFAKPDRTSLLHHDFHQFHAVIWHIDFDFDIVSLPFPGIGACHVIFFLRRQSNVWQMHFEYERLL